MITAATASGISDALDAIDALELERKLWLDEWKTRMESARGTLNMLRADVRQMQLGLAAHDAPAVEPEWRRLHPDVGPVPSDPDCKEWRTADEIRDGVPRFQEIA